MTSVRSILRSFIMSLAAILLVSTPRLSYGQMRLEVRPVESITLTTQRFLTGDKSSKSAVLLAGELRIPKPGTDKLSAVVLIPGCSGINSAHDRWIQEINSIGVTTFVLDSLSGRGLVNTCIDQPQLDSLAMMVDAYRALGSLAQHPRIDPNRIAILGFSKGAVAAIYSSTQRFQQMHGPSDVQFAAHVGLYTPCDITYRDDNKTTGKPIRLFHGTADDWVAIEPCRKYAERLRSAGGDISLTEYSGAHHAYDYFYLKEPVKVLQAPTIRNCLLAEGNNGAILNSNSGGLWDWNDSCVERGTTVASNEEATRATTKAVKEFLTTLASGQRTQN
jgi:dienelactone hydrolase